MKMANKNLKIKTKNRIIYTSIPAPGTEKILKKLKAIESRSMHGQMPIVWKKAKNFNVYDIAGNKFIDFTSTIFVANIGHSNVELIKRLKKTLNNNLLSTYSFANEIRTKYLEKLLKFAGNKFKKGFLLSSGTEASEVVLKLMKLYGLKKNKKKLKVISINGNWHGRTMGAQSLSSDKSQSKWLSNKKDVNFIDFPYPWILKEQNISGADFAKKQILKLQKNKKLNFKSDVCGLILETFQGWGALFYPKDFVKYLSNFCKKNNIIFAFDEMQSGFSRTGKNFGFMHYGVEPDLICCGKGMGGGLPISGVIGKKELLDLPDTGSMSSTHSANPLVCEAGNAVIDEINKKNLNSEVSRKGKILSKELKRIKIKNKNIIKHISSKGLIAAIIFNKNNKKINKFITHIVFKCMQKGVLFIDTKKAAIKIGPPLVITDSAILEGIKVLENTIAETRKLYEI